MHSSAGVVAGLADDKSQELGISGKKILKKTAAMGASQPQQGPKEIPVDQNDQSNSSSSPTQAVSRSMPAWMSSLSAISMV